MTPIKPMLAVPQHKGTITTWTDWVVEEKYDGHRLMVNVSRPHDRNVEVNAFARPRGSDEKMLARELPQHLVDALAELPLGWYDGELLVEDGRGWQHTDVVRLDLADKLTFVVFDLLETVTRSGDSVSLLRLPYSERRKSLERLFVNVGPFKRSPGAKPPAVWLAESSPAVSQANVTKLVKRIWDGDGEGAILKRTAAPYVPGKRSPDFVKVKRVEHATLTVVGFEKSRGTVRFPGHPFAIVKLRDDEGNETTCKTLDDVELKKFDDEWNYVLRMTNKKPSTLRGEHGEHPAIGRRLLIEFNKRTRTGGYEGPVRWDRWAEEGE